MRKDVDISSRFTAYTAVATINGLPADEKQMDAVLGFLFGLRNRKDTSLVIRTGESELPQEILAAATDSGIYMELSYQMDDFDWKHPLVLAHDHLTEEEAFTVLIGILEERTDNISIIMNEFRDVTSLIYPDEDAGSGSEAEEEEDADVESNGEDPEG